ncbi:MAG: MotA/TolQ/ExbB proton channel family protein [Myxococcota bacterium]
MNIETAMRGLADLGASWILWVLIVMSLTAVAIAIERLIFFRRHRDGTAAKHEQLLACVESGRVREAVELLGRTEGVEARVALAAISATEKGPAAAKQAMEGATERARIQMERGLSFLGTVGSNAPFVGLLGTVIGIIRAFRYLDESAGRVSAGLMTEVGEALIATAVGILVAIPAVAAFNAFQGVVKRRLASARALASELIARDRLVLTSHPTAAE